MSSPATEVVTLACDEPGCTHSETGPATGRGSAPFKLASHKWNRHGIKADGTRRAPTGKARAEEKEGARAVLATVTDIAGDVKGEGAPTQNQLERAGSKIIQVGSAVAAAILVETDEGLRTEEERREVEDRLTITGPQARALTAPIAKAVAPSKMNKRFGRTAVDVAEVAEPVGEVILIGVEYLRYFRERRTRQRNVAPGVVYLAPGVAPMGPDLGPPNPGGTATTGEEVLTSGTPGSGRIVTAEDVQAMQARRG